MTATAGVNGTTRPEAVLDRRIRELIGRIEDGVVQKRGRILWMGCVTAAFYQGRMLEKVGALVSVAERDDKLARTPSLEAPHRIRGDADLTETVEQLFRGDLLRCLQLGRTGPIRGNVQWVKIITFEIRQQAKLANILLWCVPSSRPLWPSRTSGAVITRV